MNADRFLVHYERIADAPDAISRIRKFILDLAVRGKLVEQNPADEPASELLKRIAEEKARLVKAGKIPKIIPTIPGAKCAIHYLPDWRWSQIADIGVLSPRNDADDHVQSSFIPRMPLIASGFGLTVRHKIRRWGEIKRGYTHFAEGDVGLAKITPCFENGKSAVFRNLTGGLGSGTTELHIVRPLFVDPDYILIFLKCTHFIESGIPNMTGTAGQKRVPTEYFASSPFPLPPYAEQHRIVAKVDELMALCDQLEAARAEREATRDRLTAASLVRLDAPDPDPATFRVHAAFALENLAPLTTRLDQIKALRQTILNLAVRGKLVEQDPADEPVEHSLRAIRSNRDEMIRNKELRREKPVSTVVEDTAPFDIPDNWKWVRVGDLALFTQYGTSAKAAPSDTGVPVLTMGNIQDGAVIRTNEKRIPDTSDELPALYLKNFDLLYNRTNSAELVGKTGLYQGEDDWLTFASYLIRIRISADHTSPIYVNLAMNAPDFRTTQIVPYKETNGASKRQWLGAEEHADPPPTPRRTAPYRGEGR